MNKFGNNKIDPRVCWYRLGNKIRKTINKCLDTNVNNNKNSDDLNEAIDGLNKVIQTEDDNKQLISYENLTLIHKYLQRIDSNYDLYFYQLLDECRVVLPQTRKNQELENRLIDLNCKQSNKDYNSMTYGMNRLNSGSVNPKEVISIGSELRQIRPTLIAVANAFLTIGGTFLFCYKAVEYSLPEPHISTQVLSGLFGGLIVAMAEIYFLVRII